MGNIKVRQCKVTLGHNDHLHFDEDKNDVVVCRGVEGPQERWNMLRSMGQDITKVEFPKYAWPGSYELFFIMDDSGTLCVDCANDSTNPVHFNDEDDNDDGWKIIGVDHIGNTDEFVQCDHCNKIIQDNNEDAEGE